MTEYIIEAENIGCVYPELNDDGLETGFLNGIWIKKIKIPRVGITALVGDSGSGKSTLLGLISGLREENIGFESQRISYSFERGNKISLLDNKNIPVGEIGFVFQDSQLVKTIPARYNAEMAARIANRSQVEKNVEDIAKEFKVFEQLELTPEVLSGGQSQRIAVIRALALGPNLLVCDEPTSSLDQSTGDLVMQAVSSWSKQNGCAVLWVTHNIAQAAKHSEFLFAVANGRLISEDEGRPFNFAGMSLTDRQNFMFQTLAEASKEPKLDNAHIKKEQTEEAQFKENSDENSDISEIQNTLSTPVSSKFWKAFHLIIGCLNFYKFLLMMGFLEIYPNSKYTAKSAFSTILNPFKKVMTWVFILGIVVIFILMTAQITLDNNIKNKLNLPENSHFTFESKAGFPLTMPNIDRLRVALAPKGQEINNRTVEIFGRRTWQHYGNEVWLPFGENGDCSYDSSIQKNKIGAAIVIFDPKEPLYKNLAPQKEINSLMTKALYRRLTNGGEFDPEKAIKVCLYNDQIDSDNRKYLQIEVTALIESLPGTGDWPFDIGFSADILEEHIDEYEPKIHLDDNGDFSLPKYDLAAIYFKDGKYKQVSCKLKEDKDCGEVEVSRFSEKLILNPDVIKSVSGLLKISDGIRGAFWGLSLLFAISLIISSGLSVSAYIQKNEKSIAIVKAFGGKLRHINFLLFSQTLLLFINALAFTLILFLIVKFFRTQIVIFYFDGLTNVLQISSKVFIYSGATLLIVTVAVSMSITGLWWRKRKYLGETLQAI